MYIGFNIKLQNFFTSEQLAYYYAKGQKLFSKYSKKIENHLEELILEKGNIDGEKMQSNWFPEIHADIFLSHSHRNEKEVISLAGYLNDKFGIEIFIDSCIWGYSADLLKKLDDNFCKMDNGLYDYQKRNFTTSNVHMMLSTALTKMIDRTECLFFYNTPESISIKDGVKASTISPWIYFETEISKFIKRKNLSEYRIHRDTRNFSKAVESLYESIEYPVDLKHLTDLNGSDVMNWVKNYNEEKYALDVLYTLKQHDLIL